MSLIIDISTVRGKRNLILVSKDDFQSKCGEITLKYLLTSLSGYESEKTTLDKWIESLEIPEYEEDNEIDDEDDENLTSRKRVSQWLTKELNEYPRDYDVSFDLDEDCHISIWNVIVA